MSHEYVDLQVNGFAGVDFNRAGLTPDMLHDACASLRVTGVEGVLVTIITADIAHMANQLSTIARLRERDSLIEELVWGFHIEGPFINPKPGYAGAHPREAVHPADLEEIKRLLEAGAGLTRVVTLAPECDKGLRVTDYLVKEGIRVAAGHCDPSLMELDAAIDAGLSMFTHLGNGCPMRMHRHENVIQRVLSRADRLWISFIADGVHVPFTALGNYLRLVGTERSVVVTDAISAAGLGPGTYTLGDRSIVVGEDRVSCADDRSHFMGSATTMPRAVDNLRNPLSLSDAEIKRLVSENPRRVLRQAGI